MSDYGDQQCLSCARQNMQFRNGYANKNYPYRPKVDYSANWLRDHMNAKAPEPNEGGGTFSGMEIAG